MAKGLDALKVVPFTGDRVPNQNPTGNVSWQVYHGVRNALVQTCRQYGPTGPMGIIKIVEDVENPLAMLYEDRDFWESGDPDPTYFIIDDQYNHERYCYAELYGDDPFGEDWLLAVASTLRGFKGWGLAVGNIPESYAIIFGKRIMVKGRLGKCRSASEVVETARRLLKRGSKRWWQFWR